MPRRPTGVLVAAALAIVALGALVSTPSSATRVRAADLGLPSRDQLVSDRDRFRNLAEKGIRAAKKSWWDSRRHWYDDRLNDHDRYPLATIWSIVPLFEAVDAAAMANPSSANKRAVKSFAKKAETYFDKALKPNGGFAPYPSPRGGRERAWFDDNGWWGLAFVDAYRVTHRSRYLTDASRALDFIARRGWSGSGVWWNTSHPYKAGEALSSGTALAASLYEYTGKSSYLKTAHEFLDWANANFRARNQLLYRARDTDGSSISYIQGPMIGANEKLCRKAHDQTACDRAEEIAEASLRQFGEDLDHGPQFDTIYLHWMLELYRKDGDRRWYALAYRNAKRVADKARDARGLYLRAWDGGSIRTHQARPGMVQTHAAAVELFAWLAAAPIP